MYLAQISLKNSGGCYRFNSNSLDEIRVWAKAKGQSGDELLIVRNGSTLATARRILIS